MSDSVRPDSSARHALLDEVIEDAIARARAGDRVSIDGLVARHPMIERELREFLPPALALERASDERRGSPGSTAPATGPAGRDLRAERTLGDYRLVREIGRGGMGLVWEAEQVSLGRRVALKLLPRTAGADASARRRFEIEAQAAARLRHPHVVTIFDVGEEDGAAFYAMELVDGAGLDSVIGHLRSAATPERSAAWSSMTSALASALASGRLDGRPASALSDSDDLRTVTRSGDADGSVPEESRPLAAPTVTASVAPGRGYFTSIAKLGAIVADALAEAHSCGVVHRDVKPSNLLLDRCGKIWVADFGLAKLLDDDGLTRSGDAVGTLRYMGPERFRGWTDPRSDIYGLGATLYELITLAPLFDASDRASLVRSILSEAPQRPRSIDSRIPKDLETIILQATAKEPAQRYSSANALGEDLRRFAEGRPILARRAGPVERAWLFARRNPLVTGLLTLSVAASVMAGLAALQWRETSRSLEATVDSLEEERSRALDNLWSSRLEEVRANRLHSRPEEHGRVLATIAEAARHRASVELRSEAIAALCGTSSRVVRHIPAPAGSLVFVAPSGREAVFARDGEVRMESLDEESRRWSRTLPSRVWEITFSPDGTHLICDLESHPSEILRAADGEAVAALAKGQIAYSFHPRRGWLAGCDGRRVRLVDLATGRDEPTPGWADGAFVVAFHPERDLVAKIDAVSETIAVQDVATSELLAIFERPSEHTRRIDWAPDGRAFTTRGNPLTLWRLDEDAGRHVLDDAHFENRGGFSPSGELYASADWDGYTRIRDTQTGELLGETLGSLQRFVAGDARVVLTRGDGADVVDLETGDSFRRIRVQSPDGPSGVLGLSLDPRARWLAMGTMEALVIWDLTSDTLAARLPLAGVSGLAWSPDGTVLFTGLSQGTHAWPVVRAEDGWTIGPPRRLAPAHEPYSHAVSPSADGRWLAARWDAKLSLLDLLGEEPPRLISFPIGVRHSVSPDGRYFASGSYHDLFAPVWERSTGREIHRVSTGGQSAAHFLPDGRLIVGSRARYDFLEPGTWRTLRSIPRPAGDWAETAIAHAPEGRLLALLASNRDVEIRTSDGDMEVIARLSLSNRSAAGLALDPAGRFLAAGVRGGLVHVWNLHHLRRGLRELGLDWSPPAPPTTTEAIGAVALDPGSLELRPARRPPTLSDRDLLQRYEWRTRRLWSSGAHEEAIGRTDRLVSGAARRANSLAWYLVTAPPDLRDPDRALELVRRALAAAPEETLYWNTLGVAHLRRRDWNAAIAALEKSLAAATSDASAAYDLLPLATARARQGDGEGALREFERAREWFDRHAALSLEERSELRQFWDEAAESVGDEGPRPPSLESAGP